MRKGGHFYTTLLNAAGGGDRDPLPFLGLGRGPPTHRSPTVPLDRGRGPPGWDLGGRRRLYIVSGVGGWVLRVWAE